VCSPPNEVIRLREVLVPDFYMQSGAAIIIQLEHSIFHPLGVQGLGDYSALVLLGAKLQFAIRITETLYKKITLLA